MAPQGDPVPVLLMVTGRQLPFHWFSSGPDSHWGTYWPSHSIGFFYSRFAIYICKVHGTFCFHIIPICEKWAKSSIWSNTHCTWAVTQLSWRFSFPDFHEVPLPVWIFFFPLGFNCLFLVCFPFSHRLSRKLWGRVLNYRVIKLIIWFLSSFHNRNSSLLAFFLSKIMVSQLY